MTDKQPEALRLADELLEPIEGFPNPTTLEKNAAALLRTQHAAIERLTAEVSALSKQNAAYKLLSTAQEGQLSQHRQQADKYREAITTLQSERDANAVLTEALQRKDALLRHVLVCIASAKLCEINSMSSRAEMLRILGDAQDQIKKELQ